MDAQALVGELVPPGSVFAFLAEHRHELFPDSFIADLFTSRTGRPSLPADLIGSVLVLKELYDLSDPQTADALRFDIRWKVACGRSLTQTSFDPSTLVYWRKRIADLGASGPGVRRGRGGDRGDRDAARQAAPVRGFHGVRRRGRHPGHGDPAGGGDAEGGAAGARREIGDRAGGAKLDYSKPGKPDIDWDDPDAKAESGVGPGQRRVGGAGRAVPGRHAPRREQPAADALGLLALVAGQDVEPAEDSDGTDGRWRIARRVAAGSGDLHRGHRDPAHPQVEVGAARRVPRASSRRNRRPG